VREQTNDRDFAGELHDQSSQIGSSVHRGIARPTIDEVGKAPKYRPSSESGSRPAGIESVEQAFTLKTDGPFDRAMIVSRLGFLPDALQHADTIGLGQIDLFGPEHVRCRQRGTGAADGPMEGRVRDPLDTRRD
jgi:hypothetical protein